MTKRNVVWLIVKLIGVWFAYSAVAAFFILLSSIYAYIQLPSPPRFPKADPQSQNSTVNTSPVISPNTPFNPMAANNSTTTTAKTETETPLEKAKNDALKTVLWNAFLTLIYGVIGWYLIRHGSILFAILNHEAGAGEGSGEAAGDNAFPLGRKKEKVVTTLDLSGGRRSEKSEEITSLNLSDATPSAPAATVSNEAPAPDSKAGTEIPTETTALTEAENTPPALPEEEPLEIPPQAPADDFKSAVPNESSIYVEHSLEDLATDTLVEESKPESAERKDL